MIQNGWNASHHSQLLGWKQKKVGEGKKCSRPPEWKQSFQKLQTIFLLNSRCPEFSHRDTPSQPSCWTTGLVNAYPHTQKNTRAHAHTHAHISTTKEERGRNVSSLLVWNEDILAALSLARRGCTTLTRRCVSARDLRPREKVFPLPRPRLSPLSIPHPRPICQSLDKSRLISQTFAAF